jgi:4-hydroxymandelate oxidase
MAWQRMAHADGEIAMAHAAAAQGAGWCSAPRPASRWKPCTGLCRLPRSRALWFQLYMQADRGFTRHLVLRAKQRATRRWC